MQTNTDSESVYDSGSQVWSTVLGVLVAAVLDWLCVFDPARRVPVEDPKMFGWSVALVVAIAFPAAWIVGHLVRRNAAGFTVWTVVTAGLVVAQLVVLKA